MKPTCAWNLWKLQHILLSILGHLPPALILPWALSNSFGIARTILNNKVCQFCFILWKRCRFLHRWDLWVSTDSKSHEVWLNGLEPAFLQGVLRKVTLWSPIKFGLSTSPCTTLTPLLIRLISIESRAIYHLLWPDLPLPYILHHLCGTQWHGRATNWLHLALDMDGSSLNHISFSPRRLGSLFKSWLGWKFRDVRYLIEKWLHIDSHGLYSQQFYDS